MPGKKSPDPARPGGRAARSNASGRYERRSVHAFDDGWEPTTDGAPAATRVASEGARRILTRNDSPDVPFDVSINPYRGCEHGCIYCFARPTHAWLGLSPGLDFETRILAKPDAPRLLRVELSRPGYRPEVIALGANTDPYQPVEKRLGITRAILEVLGEFAHPVGIVTKSDLVLRDLDLLAPMAERRLAHVHLSVTTLDARLARRMEPRAATPERRLAAIARLREAGIPCGVLASPMIPGLNDSELEAILDAATKAGATSASYILLRLPLELKDLFAEWLQANYPDRAKRVLGLVRDTRGGELYQSTFGTRMRGTGSYAALLEDRFELARRRFRLERRPAALDTRQFRVPRPPAEPAQLGLFPRTD
jgi:DNA repair photolyase